MDVDAVNLSDRLKGAMRRMPGAVALVTSNDLQTGKPVGLAVSAVTPVSMDPPSMLVAINRAGSTHVSIKEAGQFCINLLDAAQAELVMLFASPERRDERFSSRNWEYRDGVPFLRGAMASIFCTVSKSICHGTHEIFVGDVSHLEATGDGTPLGWIEGRFATMTALA